MSATHVADSPKEATRNRKLLHDTDLCTGRSAVADSPKEAARNASGLWSKSPEYVVYVGWLWTTRGMMSLATQLCVNPPN